MEAHRRHPFPSSPTDRNVMHSTAFTAKHLDVNCFVWPARSQNKTGRINLEEKLLNYIVAWPLHTDFRPANLYAHNVRATEKAWLPSRLVHIWIPFCGTTYFSEAYAINFLLPCF